MSSFLTAMLSVKVSFCYAECQVFLLIVLSVISHSVRKLIVIMQIVVVPANNNQDNHMQVVALWVTVDLLENYLLC